MPLRDLGRLQEDQYTTNLIIDLIQKDDVQSLKQALKTIPSFKIADLNFS